MRAEIVFLSGAGFSLRIFVFAETKARGLKPAPLKTNKFDTIQS